MPLNILIIGAGIAGPTLALLLARTSPNNAITLIERSANLRAAGLQLDFKAQGTPIIRKLGLLDAMRAHRVEESGVDVVGDRGERLAQYGVKTNARSEGRGGFTHELEVMRGDIVRVLYEAGVREGEGRVKYEFGTTVRGLVQRGDGVDVTFDDGRKRRFDLVVGADGQNSKTRGMMFGENASKEAFKEMGYQVAYFTVPRGGNDGTFAKMFFSSRSRMVMARNGGRPMTQVYLMTNSNMEKIKETYKKAVAEQKAVWTETFKDAGWETERFLEGMHKAGDFYSQEIAQVKLLALYKGRVVLIGDAGYCPSVLTGKGTTSSFIGAYVLAGELARHNSDVDAALKSYNDVMKVPVDLCQQINTGLALPSSPLAVWLFRNSLRAVSTLKIDKLIMKMMPEEEGLEAWPLPEYPELNLAE